MKSYIVLSASLLFIVFISCNRAKAPQSDIQSLKTTTLQEPNKQMANKVAAFDGNEGTVSTDSASISPSTTQKGSNPDWDKKIIKTATLKLEVKDFKQYNDIIHKTVRQFGGYIATEEQNQAEQRLETVIAIKVPVEQFEDIINQLPGNDVKVLVKKITTEDVTGQVVDTKSRLEAKRQMRLKYLDFLKQSKNMEEVLQVQDEINSIQEEIEAAAGRIEYLSHQSAYSTINLTFYQPLTGFKPIDEKPSFFDRVKLAFTSGASSLADIFIGLLSIWPVLLILIFGALLLKKLVFVKAIRHNS